MTNELLQEAISLANKDPELARMIFRAFNQGDPVTAVRVPARISSAHRGSGPTDNPVVNAAYAILDKAVEAGKIPEGTHLRVGDVIRLLKEGGGEWPPGKLWKSSTERRRGGNFSRAKTSDFVPQAWFGEDEITLPMVVPDELITRDW